MSRSGAKEALVVGGIVLLVLIVLEVSASAFAREAHFALSATAVCLRATFLDAFCLTFALFYTKKTAAASGFAAARPKTEGVFMRFYLLLILCLEFSRALVAQDVHNWASVGQLKTNDQVNVWLRGRSPLRGEFQSWTANQVTVSGASANKDEVVKVERYGEGGWSSGKKATVGALIGFGAGFAIGAAVAGCKPVTIGPCYSRGAFGAGMGGAGAIAGALLGAFLPHHHKELIYAAQ